MAGTVVIGGYLSDDALPIGDVDRDGTADVLSIRFQAATPSVKVMSGRTGRLLWSHSDPSAYAAFYVAAPGAAPMVLILSDSQTGEDAFVAGAAEDVFTVTALRPDHGTSLWSTSITGALAYDLVNFNVVGAGEFDGVLARKGAAPYLLLDRFSEADAFVAGGTSITAEVIDGSTGATVAGGQPLAADNYIFASPVGDLNGDGTDDYAVATSGDAAMIEAVSGANGTPLWDTALASPGGAAFVNFVGGSPDLTGDRKPDMLVGWSDGTSNRVAAWSGATGTSSWSHDGDYASPLGDIDHDGRSDTRVVSFERHETYAAVNATGRTLWSRDVSSPAGQPEVLSYPVGDLNGDGAVDTYLRFVARSKSPEGPGTPGLSAAIAAYIIDGRSGRARPVHDLGLPTGDSLSGRAMTFVQTLKTKRGVGVVAFNGATGRAYWHASLSSGDVTGALDVSVLPMGGHQRGLVEVLSGRTTETVVVWDGQRGTRRWLATYGIQQGGPLFL